MSLQLKQSAAVRQMAKVMYSFLPGSGRPSWKGHVSFATVARDCGVADYWQSGSKESALADLLERTLDRRPNRFEPLVMSIVRHGMTYRGKREKPITRDEIEAIDGLILKVGLRCPELSDPGFLEQFHGDPVGSARERSASTTRISSVSEITGISAAKLGELRERFYELAAMSDRQAAGYALERLLNELFTHSGLQPRKPFKVAGEQIDGSFVLDFETYLVEVRWTSERQNQSSLLVFRGKIEGKSAFTRGAFISINGYTQEAPSAITKNKQPTFFLMDGSHLTAVLEGQIDLISLLRSLQRALTEEGSVYDRHDGGNNAQGNRD